MVHQSTINISPMKGPPTLIKPTPRRAHGLKVKSILRQKIKSRFPMQHSRIHFQNAKAAFTPPPPSTLLYERSAEISDESSVESFDDHPRVTFHESVAVRFIPSRNAYKPEDKARMWSNRQELHTMTKRNAFEFAYESFRWQSACEEKEFYVINGRLVHPAYVRRAAMMGKHVL